MSKKEIEKIEVRERRGGVKGKRKGVSIFSFS